MKHLVDLEPFVDTVIEQLLERVDELIALAEPTAKSQGISLCLDHLLNFFAADAIGEIAVRILFLSIPAHDTDVSLY